MTDFDQLQCAVCGAKAEMMIGEKGDIDGSIPFCNECKDDGSCKKWLEEHIRQCFIETGMVCRIDENGRELWSDPKDTNPTP